MVKLHTNFGVITLELFADKAPETVENFKQYVRDGHYDNTIFHRVINNFMIQGGGFEPGMIQKDTRAPIKNEANNGVGNTVGTIAMARTMDPHSASAQFFINVADNSFLNHTSQTTQGWGYAVFGKETEGMDVVEKIKAVRTTSRAGHQDVPAEDVIIERAELTEYAIPDALSVRFRPASGSTAPGHHLGVSALSRRAGQPGRRPPCRIR